MRYDLASAERRVRNGKGMEGMPGPTVTGTVIGIPQGGVGIGTWGAIDYLMDKHGYQLQVNVGRGERVRVA